LFNSKLNDQKLGFNTPLKPSHNIPNPNNQNTAITAYSFFFPDPFSPVYIVNVLPKLDKPDENKLFVVLVGCDNCNINKYRKQKSVD